MKGRYTSEKYFVYFLERIIFSCMKGANTYRVLNIITFISTCFYNYLTKQNMFFISKCWYRRRILDIRIPAGQLLCQVRCLNFVKQFSFRAMKQYTWVFELCYYVVLVQRESPDILHARIVPLIDIIYFKIRISLRMTNITVASTGNTAGLIVCIQYSNILNNIYSFSSIQVYRGYE